MIKHLLKSSVRHLGYDLINADRFGVNVETDLARFTTRQRLQTIFDVGGNFGQTALRFATAFTDAAIFTFEPVPSSFTRLCDSTKHNARIKPYNVAVGGAEGIAKLSMASDAGRNSLLASKATISSIDVQVTTLDAFAAANHIGTADLLKIDVEGYELNVLQGAGTLLGKQNIRYVYAECVFAPDTLSPHTSFFDLHQFLEPHGFCFVNYYPESFALRLGCAMGNVLWALKSTLPNSVKSNIRNVI
jgi:FkbM family methyltransferase